MKDRGVTTRETVKVQCTGFQVMKNMRETGKIISKADLELISGSMEQLKISFLEIGMLATGNLARDADLVPFITQMEVNMRENGKIVFNMAKALIEIKMVFMLEIG